MYKYTMKKILLIIFLFFYSIALAVPTFKQADVYRKTASPATGLAYSSNVTTGSYLFLIAFIEDGASDINAVTDTQSNTWAQLFPVKTYFDIDGGVNHRVAVWKTTNSVVTTGADTITATWTGSATETNIHILEYNIASPAGLDGSSISAAWADDPSSGTVTTTQAGDLLIGFCVNNGGNATPPAGYTSRKTYVNNRYSQVFDKVAGTAGAESQTITTVSTNRGINILFAIKDGGGGGGSVYKNKFSLLGVG